MGIKEYLKKRRLEKYKREQTKQLQEKLDRESTLQEAQKARQELKDYKQVEKAKADIAAAKKYRDDQRRENSFFGKVAKGAAKTSGSVRQGFDSYHNTMDSMFGKPSKKKSSGDPFGMSGLGLGGGSYNTSPFGGGSSPKPRKKRRKKRSSGKTIVIKYK